MQRSKHKYARVPAEEGKPAKEPVAPKLRSCARKINLLAHSAFWMSLACFVCYYGDLLRVVQYDPRVDRIALVIGVSALSVFGACIGYMVIYLSLTVPVPIEDYARYCPRVVHSAAACMGVAFFAFLKALWPVWGWVTLPMLIVLSIAALFAPNFVPTP